MACILDRPAPQTLFDRTISEFSATVLGGGTIVPQSNEWYAASLLYAAREAWYSTAEQQWRETDPRFACCDNLVAMAKLEGIYPRPATFARGYVKITGTPGTVLTDEWKGLLRVTFNGASYRVDAGAPLPDEMPADGYLITRLIAVDPGVAGNGLTATTSAGTLTTPLAGIDDAVEIYGSRFCGGREAEDCEEFRARYLRRISHQYRSVYSALVEDMLDFPCVTRICLADCDCCSVKQRLDAFVFMDNTFTYGIPPQEILDEMTDWFFGSPQGFGKGVAPWGVVGQLRAATAVPIDITVSQLPCTTAQQIGEVKALITKALTGLCPGATVCERIISAVVVQVMGVCDFEVDIRVQGSTQPVCGDYKPACSEVAVPGTITVRGSFIR